MARKATKRPEAAPREEPSADDLDHRIVEETLALAEEVGWDGVRLRLVAERLGVPLNAVASRFRDVDAIADAWLARGVAAMRSEEHTSELQSLMRISYAVFCLKKKK